MLNEKDFVNLSEHIKTRRLTRVGHLVRMK